MNYLKGGGFDGLAQKWSIQYRNAVTDDTHHNWITTSEVAGFGIYRPAGSAFTRKAISASALLWVVFKCKASRAPFKNPSDFRPEEKTPPKGHRLATMA